MLNERLGSPKSHTDQGTFTASNTSWRARSNTTIAQGALTNSKRPQCFVNGIYPTHIKKARGPWVWDTSDKKYVDYTGALGTNLFGYANREINLEIQDQLNNGSLYPLGSTLEVECTEMLQGMIPFIERVKYLKTGTEACMASLKIARTYTGRNLVLSSGYHGWSDEFISLTEPALGVPKQNNIKKLGDLSEITPEVAAVIVEPVETFVNKEYLNTLRRKCTDNKVILIFDEVITGFRFPEYCASRYLGVTPDLIIMGKSLAGGLPLSLVGGKQDLMNCGEYFVSSTFAGDTLSLRAFKKVMKLLHGEYALNYLWEKANHFQERLNEVLKPIDVNVQGYGTRGVFKGNEKNKALLWQESCLAGVLFGSSFFYNFSLFELDDMVLSTINDVVTKMKTGGVELLGVSPTSPFSQKQRS